MSELVDYERAWLYLRAHVRGKRSHGAKELLEVMADLEMESMYGPDGPAKPPNDARPLAPDAADGPSEAMPDSTDPPAAKGGDSWTTTQKTPPPLRAVESS